MTTTLPLIPRDHLFGNPSRSMGKISPDGQWLSWLAPHDGVLNVWMAPRNDPADEGPDAPGRRTGSVASEERSAGRSAWRNRKVA